MARKQAISLLLVLLLAACGSSSVLHGKRLRGSRFSFEAPAGWKVSRRANETAAGSGPRLVSVTVLPLVHEYSPLLFSKAAAELDGVARAVATQLRGRVDSSATVTIAHRRARSYEISFRRNGEDVVERLAFVLRRKSEYQLLCRLKRGEDDSPCAQLLSTFVFR